MEFNFAVVHDAIAARNPGGECLVWGDRRFTWSHVRDRTDRLANLLTDAGLGVHGDPATVEPWASAQDHLALYLTNGNEYLEAALAGAKARVIPFNVNYRYVAEELRYLIEDAGAKGIIFHARYADTLASVLGSMESPPQLLLQVEDESGNALLPGAVEYEAAVSHARSGSPGLEPTPDDRTLLYTGGTTGMPKGVLWRQGDFVVTCLGAVRTDGTEFASLDELVARAERLGSRLRALPAAPMMHGASLWNALSCWVSGGTIVIQRHPERFEAADILTTVEEERCTSLQIVGDAFARPLLEEAAIRRRDLSSLRYVVSSGAALSTSTKAELATIAPRLRVIDILGSSEAGQMAVSSEPSVRFDPTRSARVLSEDRTRQLEAGDPEVGWLVKTGRLPCGYLNDQKRTADTFPTVEGVRYVIAGDRARVRDDGSVELLGRDSVTINTGGEKVFAEEVEQAIKHHAAVRDALVVGRPSERWGNEVVALVELDPGGDVSDRELLDVTAEYVARYKLPKVILRVDRVIRTPSGKPDYGWARDLVDGAAHAAPSGSR